jgi:hypothetical protein
MHGLLMLLLILLLLLLHLILLLVSLFLLLHHACFVFGTCFTVRFRGKEARRREFELRMEGAWQRVAFAKAK